MKMSLEMENDMAARIQLRDDVLAFAEKMSEAMDSKKIERETRNQPSYISKEYLLLEAIDRLQDKTAQLIDYFELISRGTEDLEDRKRGIKTAVHLANFAMIIAAKLEAGHK